METSAVPWELPAISSLDTQENIEMKTKQDKFNRMGVTAVAAILAGTVGALAAPPPYDTCDNAVVALAGEFNQVINDEATSASDDPDPICAFGLNFGSVFLDFVATATSAQFPSGPHIIRHSMRERRCSASRR